MDISPGMMMLCGLISSCQLYFVMAGLSRSKNRVASLAYDPAISLRDVPTKRDHRVFSTPRFRSVMTRD